MRSHSDDEREERWGRWDEGFDPCDEEGCQCQGPAERGRAWRELLREYMAHEPRGHWFFGGRRFTAWWGGPRGVNPLVGLMLSKGGGLLPLLVLHLLSQGPRYGNDIMREIETRSRGTWASNPGAIYPLLRVLEHQGLLSGAWEDPTKRTRRTYQLTDEGRKEYVHLKELMKPGLHEALDVMRALFDDLYAQDAQPAAGVTH